MLGYSFQPNRKPQDKVRVAKVVGLSPGASIFTKLLKFFWVKAKKNFGTNVQTGPKLRDYSAEKTK